MVLFDEVEKAHADVFNILLQASLPFHPLSMYHHSPCLLSSPHFQHTYRLHHTSRPKCMYLAGSVAVASSLPTHATHRALLILSGALLSGHSMTCPADAKCA